MGSPGGAQLFRSGQEMPQSSPVRALLGGEENEKIREVGRHVGLTFPHSEELP